jgi:hypothetical protein
LVNPNWIVYAVGVTGAIVMFATSWLRRGRLADLGTVSHQWLTEQRLGHRHDPQR